MTRINESHVAWLCPSCGKESTDLDGILDNEHEYLAVGDVLHDQPDDLTPVHRCDIGDGEVCIPVFAPLATPEVSTETREDMEECAEVVVGEDEGTVRLAQPDDLGDYDCGLGSKRWAMSWWPAAPHQYGLRSTPARWDSPEDVTEADAVLWVVEGKLGGAE